MTLSRITIQPGIHREGSQYRAGPSWYDCDKIRFRDGMPEQIGGWDKYTSESYKGVARSLQDWSTRTSKQYLGIGTNKKFYVEYGGNIYDVTPIRSTTAAGDVTFSATDGDATITVSDTAHGAALGDYVTFSGTVSLGGLITASVLDQEYVIAAIVDADSYEIEAKDTNGDEVVANASDTGNGGASSVGEYQVNVGTNNYISAVGYGSGAYGSGPYGGGGELTLAGQLRLYSQDVFDDDLIFCPRAGGVYFWDESDGTGTRAIPLSDLPTASNTPTVALQVMVSPIDRHVICFGVNTLGESSIDPLLVRWSSQEDAGDWTPASTNTAGGTVLSVGNAIIGAVKARQEILVFTDASVYSMRFSGSPYIYNFSVIGENVSMLSPKAGVSVGDTVYFMDRDSFYVYRGGIESMRCTVNEYVFNNLDRDQVYKIYTSHNPANFEVVWHYPANGSVDVSNYVSYNYLENVWAIGTFQRGAWIQAETKQNPLSSSNDTVNVDTNYLYNQEVDYDAEGGDIGAYIESGAIELGDGDSLIFMRRLIPDFKYSGNQNSVDFTVTINGRDYPQDDYVALATSTLMSSTKQAHVRVKAREVNLRIESNGNGYGWTMGDFRLDLRTDGKR